MTADPVPGRSLVTTRAIRDLVRSATLSVYGVSGFAGGGPIGRLLERFRLAHPGLHVEVGRTLAVDLQLTVAYGLPIAEVARQVEVAVRYTLHHALGREPDRVTIRIGHLRHEHGIAPAGSVPATTDPRASDLAASGTDVA
ncbi:MAG TPA: Asp23/Gls24 family envelope stress response protein [Candidatus Limnocylindrales bacterium]|nr:Asp23/Gls24 family envelope stress response protein [Candidatus Limnocylindrales bacterium]